MQKMAGLRLGTLRKVNYRITSLALNCKSGLWCIFVRLSLIGSILYSITAGRVIKKNDKNGTPE